MDQQTYKKHSALFREPHHGNEFGRGLARDLPWTTAHGYLSENHVGFDVNNESERMKTLINESQQPEKYMNHVNDSPRAPLYPKPEMIPAEHPRTVMGGILPEQYDRQISPNQQRRQIKNRNKLLNRFEERRAGQDFSSSVQVTNKSTLWRSKKAQRVGQSFTEIDEKLLDPNTYKYDPNKPPKFTKLQDQVKNQKMPFGPIQYNRLRLENEASVRQPSLRMSVRPRLAIDPHPEITPAGTVVVPSHVSTLCGQKLVSLTEEERYKIAEPRLPGFNKSEFMAETLGGKEAQRHAGHQDGKVHTFPIITTEGMEGQWKPWSICHDAPQFMHEQHSRLICIFYKLLFNVQYLLLFA
jgi:hypothetical protein